MTVSFPATTLTFSHSSFLFLTFVFSPWDFYSLGHKKSNNNNKNNPIYIAPKALASEALAVGQSWVLIKSFTEEVRLKPRFKYGQ